MPRLRIDARAGSEQYLRGCGDEGLEVRDSGDLSHRLPSSSRHANYYRGQHSSEIKDSGNKLAQLLLRRDIFYQKFEDRNSISLNAPRMQTIPLSLLRTLQKHNVTLCYFRQLGLRSSAALDVYLRMTSVGQADRSISSIADISFAIRDQANVD